MENAGGDEGRKRGPGRPPKDQASKAKRSRGEEWVVSGPGATAGGSRNSADSG